MQLLFENKEWIFSGIGVFLVSLIIRFIVTTSRLQRAATSTFKERDRIDGLKIDSMMRFICACICIVIMGFGLSGCHGALSKARLPLYDLSVGSPMNDNQALSTLESAPIILVGEHHTDPDHHEVQLAVIGTLVQTGRKVAIGLEMFRKESQPALDQWIAGESTEEAFAAIYLDNWNFPWPIYRDIFIYARDHGIPMIGLNVAEGITRQVARHGYASINAHQKKQIGNIACEVSPKYKTFIQNAFDAHAHGDLNFTYFCEAQLVWDTVMAENILAYHRKHPDRQLVILAGTGHARKMGIPAQIKKRSGPPVLVILPTTENSITIENTGFEDADFLFGD